LNFTKTIINAIKYWVNSKLNNYVEIVEGKGLSTEDYTTEEKEKVASIEAGAQKNIQPDWNQNDESADDYVKNRPFYTGESVTTTVEVLPEINSTSIDGDIILSESLVEGRTYTVVWDGVEYDCIARNYDGYLMLGNNAIYEYDGGITTDTGEPFAMETEGASTTLWVYMAEDKDFTLSISYSKIQENIVKLPMQYLPDGYPYKESYVGEIVPETTVNIENTSNPALDPFAIEFTAGKTYTVTWDDVEYECVSYIAKGPNTPSIGNGEIADVAGGNGEPFFCTVFNDQVMLFAAEVGSHTIAISGTETRVVKMAKEYVDSNVVVGVVDSSSYNYRFINANRGATAQEIIDAVKAGNRHVFINMDLNNWRGMLWYHTTLTINNVDCLVFTGIKTNNLELNMGGAEINVSASERNKLSIEMWVMPTEATTNENSTIPGKVLVSHTMFNFGNIPIITYAKVGQTVAIKSVSNMHAPTEWEAVDIPDDYVSYNEQELTEDQQVQARANIGAADNKPKDNINLVDQVNGYTYIVCMRNGNLVTYCQVEKIEVTTMPTTTEYIAGEAFDPTGMVITATAYDGTTKEVSDYTYSTERLTEDMTSIEIVYTENGANCSVTVPITVNPFDAETILVDFEYTDNGDGTYTLTGWKGTYNGEASTEMIIPDYACIIV